MKLKKPIFGVRAGEVYPQEIPAGEICPPELVDAARATGALDGADEAESAPPAEAKPTPRRTKARRAAPENKGA